MEETMKYLGIDVHVKTSVWCLLDESGQIIERGKVATTALDLSTLLKRLTETDALVAGQEVGKMSYFVHDVCAAAGVKLLSFNAYHLRMIASSRKKTDTRDSYWLAKTLQTGMTPHPVYIPTGTVRLLRSLLSQRQALLVERRRWLARARAHLQGAGYKTKITRSVARLIETAVSNPDGIDECLAHALQLCDRMERSAEKELRGVEERLFELGKPVGEIERLMTIPGIGNLTAIMIYAWVGDISRFRNARLLASYAGLAPSTHQSGDMSLSGPITKEGAGQLRSCLVQCGHVLLSRCQTKEAQPLKALAERVHTTRARRKIAVVAAARHILRVAYYVLRDGSVYEPDRLRPASEAA
jgi:transposase